jgi:orotidine-5'-phosphate decarboxylase
MIQKLISAIQRTDAPIVVGLDPKLSMIPDRIKNRSFEEFGQTPEGAADALWQFNKELIDNIYDVIPAVKPQIAMYEQFGIDGLLVYKRTVDYCHEKGLYVIGGRKVLVK